MKKNVIVLLIDGLNADYIGEKSYKKSPTPFFDSLKEKEISFENVYSSGPYTECAMIDLMGGYRSLDYNSFLENLKYAPKTLFEAMQDNGYITYSGIYEYANVSSFERGVDVKRVYQAPSYRSIYFGRIRFYAEQFLNHSLPQSKYQVMINLMTAFFEAYESFLEKMLQGDDSVSVLRAQQLDKDIEFMLQGTRKEKEAFESNPKEYVEGLMRDGLSHSIFAYEYGANYAQSQEMTEAIDAIKEEYKETIEKMKHLQVEGNRRHIGGFLTNTLKTGSFVLQRGIELCKNKTLTMERIKDAMGMPVLELSIYTDYLPKRIMDKGKDVLSLKYMPCCKDLCQHFLDWYDNDYTKEKPFFSYLHFDDIHVSPIPFSYTTDRSLLKEEFQYMKEYVDSLDNSYHGNIMYDVALHHMDEKIRQFFVQLEKRNLLDNTEVLIMADHGYYYSYNAFRQDSIGNMYRENFHIPLIWVNASKKEKGKEYAYYAQRDIPFSIVKEVGGIPDQSWQGISMFEEKGRPWIQAEYPGRGSPDLETKQLYLWCFNERYKVCVKAYLKENLSFKHVVEIYDEKNDPYETRNLVKKQYDVTEVANLYQQIENRFLQLQTQYLGKDGLENG